MTFVVIARGAWALLHDGDHGLQRPARTSPSAWNCGAGQLQPGGEHILSLNHHLTAMASLGFFGIVFLFVTLAISLAIVVPFSGVLVRFRANFNPKGLRLDEEGSTAPPTGPAAKWPAWCAARRKTAGCKRSKKARGAKGVGAAWWLLQVRGANGRRWGSKVTAPPGSGP